VGRDRSGASANIYAVLVWHFHSQPRVYRDVVVQVSDDPTFRSGVTTIFSNDFKNELGLGAGKNLNYIETYQGKLIDAKGVTGGIAPLQQRKYEQQVEPLH